jgi:hypothetical protein
MLLVRVQTFPFSALQRGRAIQAADRATGPLLTDLKLTTVSRDLAADSCLGGETGEPLLEMLKLRRVSCRLHRGCLQ